MAKEHEKMLNITNDQRNANQNYNVIPPYSYKNGHNQKVKKQMLAWMQWSGNTSALPVGMWTSTPALENIVGIP